MSKRLFNRAALVSAILANVAVVSPSWGVTFTVNALNDAVDANPADGQCATAAGTCTLRAAVMQANATPGADIIQLGVTQPNAPYVLNIRTVSPLPWGGDSIVTEGDLDITESLTIRGANTDAAQTVIDAGGAAGLLDRIFEIRPAFGPTAGQAIEVVMENFTITRGYVPQDSYGGGGILVYNVVNGPTVAPPPKLTLRNMVLFRNFANSTGSGLSSFDGDVTIEDSVIRENTSSFVFNNTSGINPGQPVGQLVGGGAGGGLAAWGGAMTVRRTLIDANRSQVGGGVYTQDASATPTKVLIEDSVISANQGFLGAGIFSMARGTFDLGSGPSAQYGMTLNRVTMETNIAEFAGGAIYNVGSTLMTNAIVSSNQALDVPGNPVYRNRGGGVYNSGRVMHIVGSTIAGNEAQDRRTEGADANAALGGDEIFLDYLNGTGSLQNAARFSFTIQNTIIGDGPPAPPDEGAGIDDNCHGPTGYAAYITSLGNNIDSGSTCFVAPVAAQGFGILSVQSTDIVNPPAGVGLGTLADNGARSAVAGGATIKTRALQTGSPAIGTGAGCPGSDGRGFARVGACDIGSFQVNVDRTQLGNAAPYAAADLISATAGRSVTINVLSNDRDPDGNGLLTLVPNGLTAPANGTAVVSGTSVIYTPQAGFGATVPAEDTFTYSVSDGTLTGTGTATVVVYPPGTNNPPTPERDSATVFSGVSVSIDVLANDLVGDRNNLSADRGDVLRLVSATSGNPGAGDLKATGSSVVFRSNGGFVGQVPFTYVVDDNRHLLDGNGRATGTGTIIVVANASAADPPASTGPQVDDITLSVAPGNTDSKAINAFDPTNPTPVFTYSLETLPTQGEAKIDNADIFWQVRYTASATATPGSTDTFTIGVSNGTEKGEAVVKVNIIAATTTPGTGNQPPPGSGQAPVATATEVEMNRAAGRVSGSVAPTGNPGNSPRYIQVSNPANGRVVSFSGLTGAFTYEATSLTATSDSFRFVVETGAGASLQRSAEATVTIKFVGDAPAAGTPGTGDTTNPGTNPPPSSNSSGDGGGALDPAWLALLLAPMFRRRQR